MIKIQTDKIAFTIDKTKLKSLTVSGKNEARKLLSKIWDADTEDLSHYFAIFYDKKSSTLTDNESFISVSFSSHGYMMDSNEAVSIVEARKQIEIDLEIINRESQWGAEDSIYFDQWWPEPKIDKSTHMLEFGVSLKDFNKKVFNRTLNRLILTRYGHVMINYSLSESDLKKNRPLSYYQKKLDEVTSALSIDKGYRYQDVDNETDTPSRSRMINLVLSSEIF